MYFWAIFFPPLAAFRCGVFTFLVNIPLTCLGIIPGQLHAILATSRYLADGRHREILKEQRAQTAAMLLAQKEAARSRRG
jgi:uncharacterized membrane protein YqaE (UPF0057 family)